MKIKVITSNPGKVKEFQKMFSSMNVEMEHYPHPYDEIQTSELEEVVKSGLKILKAEGLENFIIDDSGMFVDALKGFPGVYSAYGQKTIGNKGILKLMENESNRKAVFKCCIGGFINGKEIIVTGKCDGFILAEEKGNAGFGYDPIFSHDGKKSFSEISLDEKNEISHRGNALRLFEKELRKIL